MNAHVFRSLLISVITIFLSQSAIADEFSIDTGKRPFTIGFGALYKDKPYEDYDSSEENQCGAYRAVSR